MEKTLKALLIDILNIIEYQKDKDQFSAHFLSICMERTIIQLISKIPESEQEILRHQLVSTKFSNNKQIIQVFEAYYPESGILDIFSQIFDQSMEKYIQAVTPTLNEYKKQQLGNYFNELSQILNASDSIVPATNQ